MLENIQQSGLETINNQATKNICNNKINTDKMKQNLFQELMVSYYEDIYKTSPIELSLGHIARLIMNPNNDVAEAIDKIRANHPNSQKIKEGLPGFCFAGLFDGGRKLPNMTRFNGSIMLDIDNLSKHEVYKLRKSLEKDESLVFGFISPSGNGYKTLYTVSEAHSGRIQAFLDAGDYRSADKLYKRVFDKVADYFETRYGVEVDRACSDLPRLCFMSVDPRPLFKKDAKELAIDLREEAISENPRVSLVSGNVSNNAEYTIRSLPRIYEDTEKTYQNKEGMRNPFLHRFAMMAFSDSYSAEEIYSYMRPRIQPAQTFDDAEMWRTIRNASNSMVAQNRKSEFRRDIGDRYILGEETTQEKTTKRRGAPVKKGQADELLGLLNQRFDFRVNTFSNSGEMRDRLIDPDVWNGLDSFSVNDIKNYIYNNTKNSYDRIWQSVAFNNSTPKFNPISEYLKSVKKQDEDKDYIAELVSLVKTDNDELFSQGFYLFIRAMVSNWLGESANENMLIFKGREGVGKTLFCKRLIPEGIGQYIHYYSPNTDERELILALYQKALIVCDEINNFKRISDTLSKHITADEVSLRPLYEDFTGNNIRRASLVGTTNLPQFLTGAQGERRYMVVEMLDCDVQGLLSFDYDSLYAQVYKEVISGEFNLYQDEALIRQRREQNQAHVEDNPIDNLLDRYCKVYYDVAEAKADGIKPISSTDILTGIRRANSITDLHIKTRDLGIRLNQLGVAKRNRSNRNFYYITLKEAEIERDKTRLRPKTDGFDKITGELYETSINN